MSDHVKQLWDARTWFKVAKTFEAQAARIAELEAALNNIIDKTKHGHPMTCVADIWEITHAALKGGKDE